MTHIHTKLPNFANLMTKFGKYYPTAVFYGLRADNPLKYQSYRLTDVKQIVMLNCDSNSFYSIQPYMFPNLQTLYMFSPSYSWPENKYAITSFSNRYNPMSSAVNVFFEYNLKNYDKFLRDGDTDLYCPYVKFLEPNESRILRNDMMYRKYHPMEKILHLYSNNCNGV